MKIREDILAEAIENRRYLHKNPEISFEEYNTAEYIKKYLEKNGIEYKGSNVLKTAVTGEIKGGKKGKTIVFRADIDALPLEDVKNVPYTSEKKGVMHACGHDVHTAVLLGALCVLSENRENLNGNVRFVFQPGEETDGGALPLIEEGLLDGADAAFAYHVTNEVEAGQVYIKKGSLMASPDHFNINIKGKGGHGGLPANCINPITIAGEIVVELAKLNEKEGCALSVCKIDAGTNSNIVPDDCFITGTARSFDDETRSFLAEKIGEIAENISKKYNATAEYEFVYLYPPLVNNDEMVELFAETAKEIIGEENVIYQPKPDMLGEDFAYFSKTVPSCMVKLGGAKSPLHSSDFDFDENGMETGIELMVALAENFLGNSKNE